MQPTRLKPHRSKRNKTSFSRFLKRHPTLFTSLVVLIIGFFVWSMLGDKIPDIARSTLPTNQNSLKVNQKNNEILKLTKQLLSEQNNTKKPTKKLHNQNVKLKTLLKGALDKTNHKDQGYIDALSKLERFKGHATQSDHTLAQTDYYNKVRISLNSKAAGNQIQQQVNQLIQQKHVSKEGKYLKTLKQESHVRRNEVRSIVLKKGDTLWALARRAYGKGSHYPKILKANPQITKKNIRRLQLGTVIRVPL